MRHFQRVMPHDSNKVLQPNAKKLLQQKTKIELPAPEKIVACIDSFNPNIQFYR